MTDKMAKFNEFLMFSFNKKAKFEENSNEAFIIDNGSYRSVFGISSEICPRVSAPPIVMKLHSKSKKVVMVGNDLKDHLPVVPNLVQSPFYNDVVTNFELMESVLDNLFDSVSPTQKDLEMPVLMTEALCNPSSSRNAMAEILFECYGVSAISFGIDLLFSHHYNASGKDKHENELIISVDHNSTTVVPFIDGVYRLDSSSRIPLGGKLMQIYLNESLKKANPRLKPFINEENTFQLVTEECFAAESFQANMERSAAAFEGREPCPFLKEITLRGRNPKEAFFEAFLGSWRELCESGDFKSGGREIDGKLFRIRTFDDLEVARQFNQIIECLLRKKAEDVLEYSTFLMFINQLGVETEENLLKIAEQLKIKISKIEEKHSFTVRQHAGATQRVKTRERSRKSKNADYKRVRVLSQISDPFGEVRTKYWYGSRLDVESIDSKKEMAEAISEFEFWNKGPCKSVGIGIELFKTPEVLFQPSLVGLRETGGVVDVIRDAFSKNKDFSGIFVTGGGSQVRGFVNRIEHESKTLFPPGEPIPVFGAEDPVFDPWKGARLFAQSEEFRKTLSEREEYLENGISALFTHHRFSNRYPEVSAEEIEEFEF